MKGYEGWSFSDKSFAMALGLSLVWHLFWFSMVTVSTNLEKRPVKPRSRIVFLGPVLDEKIFRTLVESKPELSKALPRKFSEFSEPVDTQIKTAERYNRGSVLNLPLEKRSLEAVNGLIGGTKTAPQHKVREGSR